MMAENTIESEKNKANKFSDKLLIIENKSLSTFISKIDEIDKYLKSKKIGDKDVDIDIQIKLMDKLILYVEKVKQLRSMGKGGEVKAVRGSPKISEVQNGSIK